MKNLSNRFMMCPYCDSAYLHQNRVEIWFREEDAETGLHTITGRTSTINKISMKGNPSSRRDGIMICFYCEECDRTINLSIVQHKGNTIVNYEENNDY